MLVRLSLGNMAQPMDDAIRKHLAGDRFHMRTLFCLPAATKTTSMSSSFQKQKLVSTYDPHISLSLCLLLNLLCCLSAFFPSFTYSHSLCLFSNQHHFISLFSPRFCSPPLPSLQQCLFFCHRTFSSREQIKLKLKRSCTIWEAWDMCQCRFLKM